MFTPLILSLSLLLSPASVAADPVPVLPDDADVNVDYDLAVDLEDSEIDVEMAIDITYTKPQQQDGNRIVRFFMTEWHAFLPSSAADISVSDADGPLSFTVDPVDQPGLVLVMVDFRRNLSSGQSLALSLSYSLPSEPPPIELDNMAGLILEDQVVVNDAAVGWAFYSDPRADTWTAEFELPSGFVGPISDDEVWTRRDTRLLEASGTDFVYDFIILENDSAMNEQVVTFADGHEITVRNWPGDNIWTQRVSEQITENLPAMIDLVGRDWPDRPLVVQQSAQTLGTAYGGWYTSGDHRITIGRSVNPELILHELSHVWFQYEKLQDRWLIEGLADEFAALTAHGPNGGLEPEVSLDEEFAYNLENWIDPTSISDTITTPPEIERWSYQAAWHLIRTTRRTIGVEAFTDVTRSILGSSRSYPGTNAPESDTGPRSWREFLDLVSDHDDSGPLAELYAEWVEGSWTEQFQQRADARQRYLELVTRVGAVGTGGGVGTVGTGDDGVLPEAVRGPMRNWTFAEAETAMDRTERFLDQVDAADEELTDRGLSIPTDLRERLAGFETVDDLADYEAGFAAASDDVARFVDRAQAVDGWQRLGLVATNFSDLRTLAIDGYGAGDFERSARHIDDGESLLDGARQRGLRRAGLSTLLVVMIIVGVLLWSRRLRRDPGGQDPRQQDPVQQDPQGDDVRPPRPPCDAESAHPTSVIDLTGDDSAGHSSSSSEEITTSQRS